MKSLRSRSFILVIKNAFVSKIFAKYFLVGGFNTLFGYLATIFLYYALEDRFHIILITLLANVICITESFLTYKFLIFNTGGKWFHEYLRCYAVYGTTIIVGVFGLWVLVDMMRIPFWLAQGGLVTVSVAISFFGHKNFTFKSKNESKKIN